MVIRWSFEAKKDYHNSLDYWEEHNGSFEYSSKIIKAVEELELELSNTPLYLGRYSRELAILGISKLANGYRLWLKYIYYEKY